MVLLHIGGVYTVFWVFQVLGLITPRGVISGPRTRTYNPPWGGPTKPDHTTPGGGYKWEGGVYVVVRCNFFHKRFKPKNENLETSRYCIFEN